MKRCEPEDFVYTEGSVHISGRTMNYKQSQYLQTLLKSVLITWCDLSVNLRLHILGVFLLGGGEGWEGEHNGKSSKDIFSPRILPRLYESTVWQQ